MNHYIEETLVIKIVQELNALSLDFEVDKDYRRFVTGKVNLFLQYIDCKAEFCEALKRHNRCFLTGFNLFYQEKNLVQDFGLNVREYTRFCNTHGKCDDCFSVIYDYLYRYANVFLYITNLWKRRADVELFKRR